jgi:hypothetical protein
VKFSVLVDGNGQFTTGQRPRSEVRDTNGARDFLVHDMESVVQGILVQC